MRDVSLFSIVRVIRVTLVAAVVAIAAGGTSLAKDPAAGNGPALETAFAKQFSAFYPYDEQRGMEPMRLVGPDGREHRLEDQRGRVVLLHFWATWCAPCVKELPTLGLLHDRMAGQADQFSILAVSLDFNRDHGQVAEFMKKHGASGLTPLLVPQDDPAWNTLTTFSLPSTFLIGPDGRVLYKMVGDADWVSPGTLAFLDNLLANQKK